MPNKLQNACKNILMFYDSAQWYWLGLHIIIEVCAIQKWVISILFLSFITSKLILCAELNCDVKIYYA